MKKLILISTAITLLGLAPVFAQSAPDGGGQSPNIDAATAKLFGDHQSFTATMEFQSTANGKNLVLPGKLSFDNGKSRFEMNMSETRGSGIPASVAAQLKSMGMDTVITISRPDLKLAYLVYPGLNSYAEKPSNDSSASAGTNDYTLETIELGKETTEGHDCIKCKATVTDKDGNKRESTVWNATDLKNFPIKITSGEGANSATMLFKTVSFNKPAAASFEAPSSYTKYDNVQTMMQTEVMKRMGGAFGLPSH